MNACGTYLSSPGLEMRARPVLGRDLSRPGLCSTIGRGKEVTGAGFRFVLARRRLREREEKGEDFIGRRYAEIDEISD
jgi:hypothetical protein